MMNCKNIKSMLVEFADERLDAATAWQVQTHLSNCADCQRISHDLEAVRQMVQMLPAQGPSARFDDALAQRLALTRRPDAAPRTPRPRLDTLLSRIVPSRPVFPALRPTLALGLVLAAGAFAAFFPLPSTVPATPSAAARAADPAFVADCVAQHHRDTAAEPLADLSAQSLAGSLDGSVSPEQASEISTPSDSSLF